MATNALTVTIGTPGGGLVLSTGEPFQIVSFGTSAPRWRRQTVESRYQTGRALVSAARDTDIMTIVLRVKDASWVAQQNRFDELVAALSQFSYTVTVTLNGHARSYPCEPADVSMVAGDTLNNIEVLDSEQTYQLTIPYNPAGVS